MAHGSPCIVRRQAIRYRGFAVKFSSGGNIPKNAEIPQAVVSTLSISNYKQSVYAVNYSVLTSLRRS
jgi:hypothetical protein